MNISNVRHTFRVISMCGLGPMHLKAKFWIFSGLVSNFSFSVKLWQKKNKFSQLTKWKTMMEHQILRQSVEAKCDSYFGELRGVNVHSAWSAIYVTWKVANNLSRSLFWSFMSSLFCTNFTSALHFILSKVNLINRTVILNSSFHFLLVE